MTSSTVTSEFQALLLAEFLVEPRLRDEFGISGTMSELAAQFSEPVAKAICAVVSSQTGLVLPPDAMEAVLKVVSAQQQMTLLSRSVADVLATIRSPHDKYNSCCRSAICHAIVGAYDNASGALYHASRVNDSWARHHHLYGLLHGARNRQEKARYELEQAYAQEPWKESKVRIAQALALLKNPSA
ncbi:MAG TPA: hypothetical protein V6D10_02635 [Trichocoleus sp.]|jgi:hypothetical protein